MTDVDTPPADDSPPGSSRMSKTTRNVVEWAAIVLVALLVAFLVKTFLFQPFYIPSESMVPSLEVNDRVLVNKLSYKLHDVNRGDIVVFERPPGPVASTIKDLIKRAVGLPGETIEGRPDGVYVNGKKIPEPYLADGATTGTFGPITLEDDQVFVMGDNRTFSQDSRIFGPIDEDLIEGRAFFRFWPLGSLDLL
ncbi:MAG TPA: signal peptidase I [Acidimicrobiales bacterium]|nr:signal peptidase I [Acidimicrobiales bacterium]